MKKLRISKLFHWLYAILMLMPFCLLIFNLFASFKSGVLIDNDTLLGYIRDFFIGGSVFSELSLTIMNVYEYLISSVFGLDLVYSIEVIEFLLTYWTCISLIYLVFDVIMYIPMLVHSWLDKASIGG